MVTNVRKAQVEKSTQLFAPREKPARESDVCNRHSRFWLVLLLACCAPGVAAAAPFKSTVSITDNAATNGACTGLGAPHACCTGKDVGFCNVSNAGDGIAFDMQLGGSCGMIVAPDCEEAATDSHAELASNLVHCINTGPSGCEAKLFAAGIFRIVCPERFSCCVQGQASAASANSACTAENVPNDCCTGAGTGTCLTEGPVVKIFEAYLFKHGLMKSAGVPSLDKWGLLVLGIILCGSFAWLQHRRRTERTIGQAS